MTVSRTDWMHIPCYSHQKSISANKHVYLTKEKKTVRYGHKGSSQLARGSGDSATSPQPSFAEKYERSREPRIPSLSLDQKLFHFYSAIPFPNKKGSFTYKLTPHAPFPTLKQRSATKFILDFFFYGI